MVGDRFGPLFRVSQWASVQQHVRGLVLLAVGRGEGHARRVFGQVLFRSVCHVTQQGPPAAHIARLAGRGVARLQGRLVARVGMLGVFEMMEARLHVNIHVYPHLRT